MEPVRAPWRVLESGVDDLGGASPAEAAGDARRPATGQADGGDDQATDQRSRTLLVVAGGAVIALALAAAAVAIVATGPRPLAVVEGGPALVAADASGLPSGASPSVRTIVVHVAGAVRRPGLVTLPIGSRVADAIDAAGGLDARADPARVGTELNLAQRLDDGQRVLVPARGNPQASAGGLSAGGATTGPGGAAAGGGGPIDLNSADATALDTLPGVGPVTATKIIAARQERPFTTVDELVTRKVVSAATLAKFRDRVVVR